MIVGTGPRGGPTTSALTMQCTWPSIVTTDDDEAPREHWPDRCAVEVQQRTGVQVARRADLVIEETPIALVYNCVSHAVMLTTPTDLVDFALGFSLTEGILRAADEMLDCDPVPAGDTGIEIRLSIPGWRFAELGERRRTLAGKTGCGLCGVESLQAVARPLRRIQRTCVPERGAIARALTALPEHQGLFRATGGGHAAAWVDPAGRIELVREDVGRHNALDKLIGALYRRGFGPHEGFVICTSRASFEMVQKTMTAGIGLLVAVSAPTGAAVRLAEQAGMTLVGFARGERMLVYSHPDVIS